MSRIDEINARMAGYGISKWPEVVKDCNYLLAELSATQALLSEARKLMLYGSDDSIEAFLAKTAPGVDT